MFESATNVYSNFAIRLSIFVKFFLQLWSKTGKQLMNVTCKVGKKEAPTMEISREAMILVSWGIIWTLLNWYVYLPNFVNWFLPHFVSLHAKRHCCVLPSCSLIVFLTFRVCQQKEWGRKLHMLKVFKNDCNKVKWKYVVIECPLGHNSHMSTSIE